MVIDFKEIPEAHRGGGLQDTFELFAREFLHELGLTILTDPNRGADEGKDLIVEEQREGLFGKNSLIWLVSCKHHAHTGNSVKPDDEPSITDRIKQHKCTGFIGFYSTVLSSGLEKRLNGFRESGIDIYTYDSEKIERVLLSSPQWISFARRFFPESIKAYQMENPQPIELFSDKTELLCERCKKNLLEDKSGNICYLEKKHSSGTFDSTKQIIHDLYFACKECDSTIRQKYYRQGFYDAGWDEIRNYAIPSFYLRRLMGFINSMRDDGYDDVAIDKMTGFFTIMFPYIARELTSDEKAKIDYIGLFPC